MGTEALLKSARQTFAQRGYDASSLREIARKAGVDVTLVTHHFGSKHALWTATVQQIAIGTNKLAQDIRLLTETAFTERERVEQALMKLVNKVSNEPDVGFFFSTAILEQGERLDFVIDEMVRPLHDALVPLLVTAMDAGQIARNDPEIVFWMLVTAISKTISYSHIVAAFSPLAQNPEAFKKVIMKVVRSMLH